MSQADDERKQQIRLRIAESRLKLIDAVGDGQWHLRSCTEQFNSSSPSKVLGVAAASTAATLLVARLLPSLLFRRSKTPKLAAAGQPPKSFVRLLLEFSLPLLLPLAQKWMAGRMALPESLQSKDAPAKWSLGSCVYRFLGLSKLIS